MSDPLSDPVSWQAVQFILLRLESVSLSAGYFSDLGCYARYDDRTQVDDRSPYVLVVARSFESAASGSGRGSASEEVELLIEFGVPRAPELFPERLIHRVRADIRRALAKTGRDAPVGVGAITIDGAALGDAPDGANLLIAQVSARAVLTDLFPPAT